MTAACTSGSRSILRPNVDGGFAGPLRILHLVGAVEDNGGVLTSLRNLAAATPPAEAEHVCLVHEDFQPLRRPALQIRRSAHLTMEDARPLRLLLKAVRTLKEVRRLLAAEVFHVLHAHSRGPLLLALLLAGRVRQPVVFTNHAYATRRRGYRWVARHPCLLSTVLTENMRRHYGLCRLAGRVEVIPECGADELFERPLPSSRPAGGPVRLVGLGNLVAWKRWDLLCDALGRLPETLRRRFTCEIWGPVPDDPSARRFAYALAGQAARPELAGVIRLAGPTPDGPARLLEADWFVLPSINEPCSLALIEALALGRPAIVSASGGNVDIVQPGRTGLLFAPDDPASLADCLARVAEGMAAMLPPATIRESVAEFKGSAVARRYLALYRLLLSGARGTAAVPPTT